MKKLQSMMKTAISVLTVVVAFSGLFAANTDGDYTIGAKTSKLAPAQTEYRVCKTDEKIVIDGRLDENIWRHTPSVTFYGITDGSAHPFLTEGKMVWDATYLYVGFYFERPDIWCRWVMKEPNIPDSVMENILPNKSSPWAHSERFIMRYDCHCRESVNLYKEYCKRNNLEQNVQTP